MSDRRLKETFVALDPEQGQIERVGVVVAAGFAARRPSLFREWLDVLRLGPLRYGVPALAMGLFLIVGSALSVALAAQALAKDKRVSARPGSPTAGAIAGRSGR